eukprot:TRINITY_DN9482_c0_g1_i4.p2 TRINITY_DN9482_c0_g1~~TRINITY_DN9482_c0_g1_i4.p2  ORF type:complete len:123 (-),score=23.30 TRINITY_DN9482_c0_g1_i4:22-390(-)
MLRSLVGSEMCIRDRSMRAEEVTGAAQMEEGVPGELCREEADSRCPGPEDVTGLSRQHTGPVTIAEESAGNAAAPHPTGAGGEAGQAPGCPDITQLGADGRAGEAHKRAEILRWSRRVSQAD